MERELKPCPFCGCYDRRVLFGKWEQKDIGLFVANVDVPARM